MRGIDQSYRKVTMIGHTCNNAVNLRELVEFELKLEGLIK